MKGDLVSRVECLCDTETGAKQGRPRRVSSMVPIVHAMTSGGPLRPAVVAWIVTLLYAGRLSAQSPSAFMPALPTQSSIDAKTAPGALERQQEVGPLPLPENSPLRHG